MGEIAMVKKTKYAAGIEIESAFGRTDYMYVYEVAPWAYDAVNDWIKVAIQGVVDVDITDDWARQLGKVDLSRYLGTACGLLNPIHTGIVVAGAFIDPRQIRALTAADVVSAAQSGVWSVGRTWALAAATDAVAAQVSNWPDIYAVSLNYYAGLSVGPLNPIHVGVTVAGAIVDPRQIRTLASADTVTADSLSKWGGTALTGRNITLLLDNLDAALSTRARLQPWYQTNFTVSNQQYQAGSVAPHAVTQRFAYTVPANRIAIVMQSYNLIMRQTVPTTAGEVAATLVIEDPAGTLVNRFTDVREISATVGIPRYTAVGQGAIATAGQLITGHTADASTGGTYRYLLTANIMVFDT